MDKKIITRNSEETINLGEELGKNILPGEVVLLFGELGAGKTTFVQGFAKGIGISDRILSPTFVLHRIHRPKNSKIEIVNHIDLYRLEEPTEIDSLGLSELFDEQNSVTLIEWADRLKNFKIKKGYEIKFAYINDDEREIVINHYE